MMYTLSDVISVIDKIDLSRTNAEPGYVYTGPDGDHCIAGQICVELGIEVPEWDDEVGNNSYGMSCGMNPNTKSFDASPMKNEFDPVAAQFIADCQSFADDYENNDPPWADCVIFAEKNMGVASV